MANARGSLDVIGGSISCLIAALEAAERGRRVRLYVTPARIGGSFAGVKVGERRLNFGVRLFELDYEDPPSARLPVASFDPERHNHRPFIDSVAATIRRFLNDDLVLAATPEMWLCGRRSRCVHFTVDVSDLPAALGRSDRDRVRRELEEIVEAETSPPWRMPVEDPRSLDGIDLPTASVANHGQRLHELLIDPHCSRQFSNLPDVIAGERRKLWVAMFHPKTLLEVFRGQPSSFRAYRPFFMTKDGASATLVDRIVAAIRARPEIEVVPVGRLTNMRRCAGRGVTLDFAASAATTMSVDVDEKDSVIGLAPEELFGAAGIPYVPERVQSSVMWIVVPEADILHVPSVLSVHDRDIGILRVSASGRGGAADGRSVFTIEFGSAAPDLTTARDALATLGLVREGAEVALLHAVTAPAQVAPTFSNRRLFDAARDAFIHGFGWRGTIFGAARRFGFDSLNDGIAEALHFGETQC
jgi:hypothetical protein